jgi:sulfate adenylyltransferase
MELKPLFVYDPDAPCADARGRGLPSITISSQAAGNAVMMGGGYFTPLGLHERRRCRQRRRDHDDHRGMFFPVPGHVPGAEDTSAIGDAKRIALRDPNMEGNPVLAVMDVENIERSATSRWR